ncbi:LOW QUALITY PROTEIN: acyl-coenzyme A oxidase-like protein [Clarias gariepinus]
MIENRIPSLMCNSNVFATSKGDIMVMLQIHLYQTNDNTEGNLNLLLKALSNRERVLQRSLTACLYTKVSVTGPLKNKEEFFSARNSCLHHVTRLALAHIHRVTLEQFALGVQDCQDREDQALLKKVVILANREFNDDLLYRLLEQDIGTRTFKCCGLQDVAPVDWNYLFRASHECSIRVGVSIQGSLESGPSPYQAQLQSNGLHH